jgi:hypothetical protein
MFDELRKPEYIHVLLNPLPVYATAMGVIALAVAVLTRSRPAQIAGLIIVLIGCGSIWPVMEYGDKGFDRVKSMSSEDGVKWLEAHEGRADAAAWFFYATAALAAGAIVVGGKFPNVGRWLAIATLIAAIVCVGLGGWIGSAGGKVRHPEFRDGPPPTHALTPLPVAGSIKMCWRNSSS